MKSLMLAGLWFSLVLLGGCSTLVPAPQLPANPEGTYPIAAYARVLQAYVNARGEVDFPALQKNRADLDTYVAYVAQIPANSIKDKNERLAHYLNSYNALSMYNVLASDIPKTHAGFAKVRFFYLRKLRIGGKSMSLYAYENDVIRKLKEPRVHFALNCSALGCPILPQTPFSGANIEQELEHETRKFFVERRNLRIDTLGKTVLLSELLRFYTKDFTPAHAPSLIGYVNRYAPEKIPADYAVNFIAYDWTVANSRR
jgi:hypothetical protein